MHHIYRRAPMPKYDFNKVAKQLRHGCSPVNLLHIFRTPFSRNSSEWLLLLLVPCIFLVSFTIFCTDPMCTVDINVFFHCLNFPWISLLPCLCTYPISLFFHSTVYSQVIPARYILYSKLAVKSLNSFFMSFHFFKECTRPEEEIFDWEHPIPGNPNFYFIFQVTTCVYSNYLAKGQTRVMIIGVRHLHAWNFYGNKVLYLPH